MLGKKGEDDDEAMLEGRDRSDLPEAAPLPPPLPSKKSQDNVRIAKFFDGISDKVNPELGNVIKAASPALVAVIRGFLFVWPYYKKGLLFCWRIYKMLPANAVQCVFGAALCFFGGTYVGTSARGRQPRVREMPLAPPHVPQQPPDALPIVHVRPQRPLRRLRHSVSSVGRRSRTRWQSCPNNYTWWWRRRNSTT